MKIAIFDYVVTPNNAIGMCHRRMMQALAQEHDFSLFSCQFDNPLPSRIQWSRVPAHRPSARRAVSFLPCRGGLLLLLARRQPRQLRLGSRRRK